MALETKLVQKLSQSLLMTPQLQQAIKLLQLGRLEYQEAIERELLENPILEEMRDVEEPMAEGSATKSDVQTTELHEVDVSSGPNEGLPDAKVDWEDYLESFTDSQGTASPRGTFDFEERPSLEATVSNPETLQDRLLEQVRFLELDDVDRPVVLQALGNLDKNGYLRLSYEEIAEECECSADQVEHVMELLRSLDPPGIFARSLSECLHIQLERLGKGGSLEDQIVLHHLDKLERRKYDQIAKAESVSPQEVYRAVTTIQTLEPHPGRPFAEESPRYIVPDVYVYKVGDEYVISLNEDGLPRLRVSPYYLKVLQQGGSEGGKAYLQDRLKAASWLIKSIQQRQQTIFRVTESIMKFQREFLDHGIEKLKPLVLKEVADDIGMHESTVSRVTTNKYVHTPQGVFELKFFFTPGIKTGTGEDVSSSAVKERIRAIIGAEPPENPVSDQRIVELLKQENVDIARRTVAKYREALGIPPSSRRKKLF